MVIFEIFQFFWYRVILSTAIPPARGTFFIHGMSARGSFANLQQFLENEFSKIDSVYI